MQREEATSEPSFTALEVGLIVIGLVFLVFALSSYVGATQIHLV
jgi:hypothetical protein